MKFSPESSEKSESAAEVLGSNSPKLPSDLPTEKMEVTSQKESTSLYGGVAGSTISIPGLPTPSTSPIPRASSGADSKSKTADPKTTRWSPSVQTLLEQPPATLPQRLLLGGIAFCAIFGGWAWFGHIEEVGKATGRLVPEGETYKIQPLEIGKVSRVMVEEGQAVKAGQVLVELDTELAQKEIDRLQEMLRASQNEIAQKQSLLERVEMEAQTRAAIAKAEELAQKSAIALAKEKANTTYQLLAQQQAEATAYRSRQIRLKPLSNRAEERLDQLTAEMAAHQKRLERLKPLEEEGAVSQEYIFQAEQALRETQQRITQTQLQEITSVNEQLFQADQSLRDLESRITQNQGELTTANKEAEQLEAQLIQKQAQARTTELEAQQKIQQLQLEIAQTQAKSAETRNLLITAQAKLKNNYLRATVDGIVLSLNLKNPGEVVEAGKTVAEIAPNGVPLVLSAVLPNQEAGFVKTGMPVKVKLDAYPYQDYGIISGQVNGLSADSKPDEKLGPVYRVEVKLERDYVTDKQQKIEFKAGQTATAEIVIRRRRIADILLDPIRQIQKDGINL
jgi:HlyD family secretion protein